MKDTKYIGQMAKLATELGAWTDPDMSTEFMELMSKVAAEMGFWALVLARSTDKTKALCKLIEKSNIDHRVKHIVIRHFIDKYEKELDQKLVRSILATLELVSGRDLPK